MNKRARAGRVTVKRALVALASTVVLLFATNALAGTEPGAAALEARLFAPCCWNGTLDAHDSELAHELRKEIEERLARGEKADDIQADFVARYGERILAARSESPIRVMSLLLAALMALAAVGLGVVLRRWRKPADNAVRRDDAAVASKRDVLDERIDAELAEID